MIVFQKQYSTYIMDNHFKHNLRPAYSRENVFALGGCVTAIKKHRKAFGSKFVETLTLIQQVDDKINAVGFQR